MNAQTRKSDSVTDRGAAASMHLQVWTDVTRKPEGRQSHVGKAFSAGFGRHRLRRRFGSFVPSTRVEARSLTRPALPLASSPPHCLGRGASDCLDHPSPFRTSGFQSVWKRAPPSRRRHLADQLHLGRAGRLRLDELGAQRRGCQARSRLGSQGWPRHRTSLRADRGLRSTSAPHPSRSADPDSVRGS